MMSKKALKHNAKFWETKCDSAFATISELKKELLKTNEDVLKYKTLYLQMLEMNLNLADKVGVNNE